MWNGPIDASTWWVCASGLTKTNVRIGSGVAVYESGLSKCLIGVHEAPYLSENSTSLLSINQAREHGVWVDDLLLRYGGRQLIKALDTDGNEVEIPLDLHSGLLGVELRSPTEAELDSLPVVWLTSNLEPWDPSVVHGDDCKIIPQFDDFIEVFNEFC